MAKKQDKITIKQLEEMEDTMHRRTRLIYAGAIIVVGFLILNNLLTNIFVNFATSGVPYGIATSIAFSFIIEATALAVPMGILLIILTFCEMV